MKAADDSSPEQKPFLDHLEDFRVMAIRCAIALCAGMVIAVPLIPRILAALKKPLYNIVDDPERFLQTIEVAGGFTAVMQMAFWCGLLFSAPFLVFFAGAFVFPALTRREQQTVLRGSGFAVGLFVFGVFLAYRFTLPFALSAMFAVNTWLGIQAQWTLTSYVTFTTQLLIAFGLASAVKEGAISTSTKCLRSFMALATLMPTSPLKAMMPPKAEVESVLNAFS